MKTQAGKEVSFGDEVLVVIRLKIDRILTESNGTDIGGWFTHQDGTRKYVAGIPLSQVEDVYGASQASV